MIEILSHRERSNSPLLVGEPGVGKTAVVEGLARLVELEPEKVPIRLRDAHIVQLQMGGLVAGTMLRGMFEERIKGIISAGAILPIAVTAQDQIQGYADGGIAEGGVAWVGEEGPELVFLPRGAEVVIVEIAGETALIAPLPSLTSGSDTE